MRQRPRDRRSEGDSALADVGLVLSDDLVGDFLALFVVHAETLGDVGDFAVFGREDQAVDHAGHIARPQQQRDREAD